MVLMVEVLTRVGFWAIEGIRVSTYDLERDELMENVCGAVRPKARSYITEEIGGGREGWKCIPPQGWEVRHDVTQALFPPQLSAHCSFDSVHSK